MPTPTDLVTDLPADFEVFGQAVDTSMADLKGGTSGQVLSKNSNTDMDFVWVTSDDANAIQNTQLTAKGALISAFSAGTPATLTVGSNGQNLMADSTAATGLVWKGAISASVYNSTAFTIANTTFTTLTFDGESWDTDSMHSTVTNTSRITVPRTGYYKIELQGIWQNNTTGGRGARFLNNGSAIFTQFLDAVDGDFNYYYPYTAKLTANDYLEVQMYQDRGGTLTWYNRPQDGMFLVTWIGA